MLKSTGILLSSMLLVSCGTAPISPSQGHIKDVAPPAGSIPEPVQQSATLRPPKPAPKVETYSVTVYKVAVQSLLFALARDAKLNIDVHPGIEGEVTLNALDQTLPQLLNRISRQVDMRYELDGKNLIVLPDKPFLRNYKVDYVNMSRTSTSNVSIATQISTTGGTGAAGGDNNSTTSVTNKSNNQFWETLTLNIKDILRETDKVLPEGGSDTAVAANQPVATQATAPAAYGRPAGTTNAATAVPTVNATTPTAARSTFREAASVIINAETGLISVRATSRQHEKIQEFLDLVLSNAKRQVLIEATVIEVQLSDQYQQGINWSKLRTNQNGFNVSQGQIGAAALPSGVAPGLSPGIFSLNFVNPTSGLGNISATIQLLESFGKVKVLSSPKISVLNNQTALLKVVDNGVYFTITATTTASTGPGIPATTTYTSELHTVPVGFVMSVTPQIADTDEVTLNVRPSISRIIGYVQDPNPALANAVVPVVSSVPVIQTREMESVLKVSSGQVAVMGGLMQDSVNNLKDSIPGINRIPVIGDALAFRNEKATKTELVIFMRPLVVKDASMTGDYKDYRTYLGNDEPLNKHPYSEPSGRPLPAAAKAGES